MILIIQTVFPEIQIGLCEDNGQLLGFSNWTSEKDEVSRLLPEIEKLLDGKDYQSIKKIVVVNGMGAFSSTRVGVTIANTLSMALGAELYSLSLEEAVDQDKLIEFSLKASKGQNKKIIEPLYKAMPMISESKKKKFT
ncbi:hypothetical protein IT412_01350 [Candidatus Peregrinibacteria bacterium]|nr:hypothetical protein [Candidatus Peregrinibacteria bacterium]